MLAMHSTVKIVYADRAQARKYAKPYRNQSKSKIYTIYKWGGQCPTSEFYFCSLKKLTKNLSLVKRKEEWAEKERENEKNKPDPDCPKGHKRVPEDERRKVLENLKKSKFTLYQREKY